MDKKCLEQRIKKNEKAIEELSRRVAELEARSIRPISIPTWPIKDFEKPLVTWITSLASRT